MLTDLYQLTMMYGYYKSGMRNNIATFDMFYRSKDESTHYAVFAGLEQLIDYLQNLRFDEDALEAVIAPVAHKVAGKDHVYTTDLVVRNPQAGTVVITMTWDAQ